MSDNVPEKRIRRVESIRANPLAMALAKLGYRYPHGWKRFAGMIDAELRECAERWPEHREACAGKKAC